MRLRNFVVLVLLISIAPLCAAQGNVAACKPPLTPQHAAPPQLPSRLHNEYAGSIVVSYIVGTNGRVRSPSIVSVQLHPVGHTGNKPVGYQSAVLNAIREWQFAKRAQACRNQTPVQFTYTDAVPVAGRSN